MAIRKLKPQGTFAAKSANTSQKNSPNRPSSSFNIQQSIEKLENIDFVISSKIAPKVSVSKELQNLEKYLDYCEINNMGITMSSAQIFQMYLNYTDNLCKIIQQRDVKISGLLIRGVKGLEKGFKMISNDIKSQNTEKNFNHSSNSSKKNTFTQTESHEHQELVPESPPEYRDFKDLPKAFENIQLTRLSSQLSEIYEELKTLMTEIPSETSIAEIKAPNSYKPLKSEEAKKIIMTELKEIKDSIELFIKKKRIKALQIHKEIQTDKEPKNATWVALEAMNEEKELALLRMRGKLEVAIAEKKKLEEGLINSNNLCEQLEKKAFDAEGDNSELRHLNSKMSEKVSSLEKRVIEMGAIIQKVISFKGFQKKVQDRNEKDKVEQGGKDVKPANTGRLSNARRPSGYLRAAEFGTTAKKETKLQLIGLENNDDQDSLKSFRKKLETEIGKIESIEKTTKVSNPEKSDPISPNRAKFINPELSYTKNKEGKYVKAEIAKSDIVEVKGNRKPKVATEDCETTYDKLDSILELSTADLISLSSAFTQEANKNTPGLSYKQIKNLLGEDLAQFLKSEKSTSIDPGINNDSLHTKKKSSKLQSLSFVIPATRKSKSSSESSNPEKAKEELNRYSDESEDAKSVLSSNYEEQSNSDKSSDSSTTQSKINQIQKSDDLSNSRNSKNNLNIEDKLKNKALSKFNSPNSISSLVEKLESKRATPNILINSRNPVYIQGKKQEVQERNKKKQRLSYNPSLSSSLSINPSSPNEFNISDKDSLYEEKLNLPSKARASLNIPYLNKRSSFSRPASRSSVYSYSKELMDFSFSDQNQGYQEADKIINELKDMEEQLQQSLTNEQKDVYLRFKLKEEEFKVAKASYLSKYVQCNLEIMENDLLQRMRCKEKYKQLIDSLFENPNDVNLLAPKGRRELAVSVKGHDLSKCGKICDHLKKAMKVVQRYRGKLYPLKIIKM